MTQVRTIRLYGKLGQKFGRVHRLHLDTNTVAESVRALDSQFRGFREFLVNAKNEGVAFAIFAGQKNLERDELTSPVGNDDIRIAPVLIGSKNSSIFNIVLGGVLIALSFVPGFQVAAPYLMNAGIGLIAGGIVQMLSPQPKGLKNGDSPDNSASYSFAGPVNTEAQGNPVPVVYGRMIVGSAVISAGIDAEDYVPYTSVGTGIPNWKPKTPYDQAPEMQ